MARIVEKPCRMDLHIHSFASTTTRDKGNKELEACTSDNLPVLLKGLADNGINACAITDHDTFDFELYEKLKEHEGDGGLELVLPGVEFTVGLEEDDGAETIIHVVAIFDDSDKDKVAKIADALLDADGKPRYDNGANTAFTELGLEGILRNIGLDAVLIGHEKSAGRGNKRDVSSLDPQTADRVILTEFVDAVEIRNRHKELDIKRLLEMYPRDDVPFVLGSDCHDWAVYPLENASMCGREDEIGFSCMKSLPTFQGLVMAITDHSRIKVGDGSFFGAGSRRVRSIELSVGDETFDIPLSAGINVIIGDNSVGKSLLLHALTDYRMISDKSLRMGYEAYCRKENLQFASSIGDSAICRFDDQQSVKTLLEELRSGDSSSPFVSRYFKKRVSVPGTVGEVRQRMKACIRALASKTLFNDSMLRLDSAVVELREVAASPMLAIGNKAPERSYTNIEALMSDTENKISELEQMKIEHSAALTEIGSLWADRLDNAIHELRLLGLGCELRKNSLEIENVAISSMNTAAKDVKGELKQKKTDEQNDADEYAGDLERAAAQLADLALLSAARFDAPIDLGLGKKAPEVTDMGDFRFVSELTTSEFDRAFTKDVLKAVFNKGAVGQIEQAIAGATELTTADVCSAISGVKPAEKGCFNEIAERADSFAKNSIRERLKVTNASLGIDDEPSPGLFSRLYFDLVAENDNPGIYIIDQPEDQISQMSIKDHVIGAFKRMAERRQVILITHNPQFVVNLDADNVIAIKKEGGQPLKFFSGALEYECDEYGILDIVANTVEGGADVVRKRLKRYGSKAS